MGYTYTARGELATITAINGGSSVVTNTYTYNRRGLPTRERMTWNNIDWSITYGYDANGHVAVQGYPGGVSVDYAPNALGQATQAGSYATNVAYFPNGAMRSFTYGNGIVHTLTQNTRGLPDRSVDAYGSTKILDDGYDYDRVGNVAGISDGATGRNQKGNRTMAYDGLNRLTSVTALDMFGTASYAYDVQDNLTHVQVTAGSQPRNVDYCYDAANRLTNIQSAAATYCGGATVTGLGYDVQGNLANKDGVLYAFDLGNRLRSVSSPASGYVYDGHGRRVRDVTAGSRYSLYSRSGQLVFASSMREAAQLRYISLNGSLVAVDKLDTGTGAVSVVYQHTDALGSPVATTNASRTVIERREYEPYGYQISPFALEDGPGYTGHMADAATGLVYMQQRYYDPVIGRFDSVDAVTALQGGPQHFNSYDYAYNNPYKFTDPDGRDGELFWTAPDHVNVTFKYVMTGVSASFTPAQLEAQVAKNYSGNVTVNGVNVTVTAQAVQVSAPGKGVNTINVVNDTAGVTKSGRSETNAIGGNKITLGATGVEAATKETGSHEVGHGLGAGDQYKGGVDVNGKTLSADIPGASNVMKDLSGSNANSQTLGEIIRAPTNVNTCAQGVSAASGGC